MTARKPMKKVSTTVYLEPYQRGKLEAISTLTRIPVAEIVREGVELVTAVYESRQAAGELLPAPSVNDLLDVDKTPRS